MTRPSLLSRTLGAYLGRGITLTGYAASQLGSRTGFLEARDDEWLAVRESDGQLMMVRLEDVEIVYLSGDLDGIAAARRGFWETYGPDLVARSLAEDRATMARRAGLEPGQDRPSPAISDPDAFLRSLEEKPGAGEGET